MTDSMFDYPSQRWGLRDAAEPMLLDTSALQHLKCVMDALDGSFMSDELEEDLLRRYPSPLGVEIVALGDLASIFHRNGPPWIVAEATLIEFERLDNEKGRQLRQWWWEWADYFQNDLDAGWYPDTRRSAPSGTPGIAP